jgi:hypothetical protein
MELSQYIQLTIEEQEVFCELCEVEQDNGWVEGVNHVLHYGTAERFRLLIRQLRSQASDDMDIMEKILGAKPLRAVLSLQVAMPLDFMAP